MDTLVVYCPDARWVSRVRAAIGATRDLVTCDAWQSFERAAPRGACLLVVVEWLRGSDLLERLQQLRLLLPYHPLILVTSKDADAVRELCHVPLDEIVWPHEIERNLARVVAQAAGRQPLERVALLIESAPPVPPRIRMALLAALRSSKPCGSIAQVAAAIGVDRRVLWREARRTSMPCRLQDLLDWVFLIRLSILKQSGRKWTTVAFEAGVHEDSIARMIRRLTGLGVRGFVALGTAGVLRRFEHDVLAPLLRHSEAPCELEDPGLPVPLAQGEQSRARTVITLEEMP